MAQKKIGSYFVIQSMERGGTAKIYLAGQSGQEQKYILKELIITNSKEIRQRFEREAQLMRKFNHPNIVKVYDYFKAGSHYYIAMEFVDGMSLDKLIREKTVISPLPGILILHQVCLGLQYAHGKGVVHRDIKPANVLIAKNGSIKLTDFGIATPDAEDQSERLTETGFYFGTPVYISPEQLESTKHVDERSDIYSMGVMLYEMMTGERPFESDFSSETITNIYDGKYVKPQKHNPHLPAKIRSIIIKAMSSAKKNRYANVQELLKVLEPFMKQYQEQKAITGQIKDYLSGTSDAY
ncbi:MAG: serine/threonine protein kinase [Spirochaetales bacterium]|nr:serine/threonine protein kinase [Spirochaetales bacterium]